MKRGSSILISNIHAVITLGTWVINFINEQKLSMDRVYVLHHYQMVYEPRCEKTCLWGFLPGPTQTRLYSLRRWLET